MLSSKYFSLVCNNTLKVILETTLNIFCAVFPERHAILTIRDASKIDSGPYRITAENELGQDSAIINIEISGMVLF